MLKVRDLAKPRAGDEEEDEAAKMSLGGALRMKSLWVSLSCGRLLSNRLAPSSLSWRWTEVLELLVVAFT